MLSNVFLRFTDEDLLRVYQREKVEFFKKSLPVMTAMSIIISTILEIIFRLLNIGNLPLFVSIINWVFCTVFLIISFLH